MACPDCDSTDVVSKKQDRKEDMYPDVYFLDVVLSCKNCGLGWHCVGTKKVKDINSS